MVYVYVDLVKMITLAQICHIARYQNTHSDLDLPHSEISEKEEVRDLILIRLCQCMTPDFDQYHYREKGDYSTYGNLEDNFTSTSFQAFH